MSQSETWDALLIAADWRAIGRDVEVARVMPEPEVKWLRHHYGASRDICQDT